MEKGKSIRHIVSTELALHTTIIVLFSLIATRSDTPRNNPVLTVAMIIAAAAVTVYTAHRIIRDINKRLSYRAEELTRYSDSLRSEAARLERYARELEQCASSIAETKLEIERSAGLISSYGSAMSELVTAIDAANGGGREESLS